MDGIGRAPAVSGDKNLPAGARAIKELVRQIGHRLPVAGLERRRKASTIILEVPVPHLWQHGLPRSRWIKHYTTSFCIHDIRWKLGSSVQTPCRYSPTSSLIAS